MVPEQMPRTCRLGHPDPAKDPATPGQPAGHQPVPDPQGPGSRGPAWSSTPGQAYRDGPHRQRPVKAYW